MAIAAIVLPQPGGPNKSKVDGGSMLLPQALQSAYSILRSALAPDLRTLGEQGIGAGPRGMTGSTNDLLGLHIGSQPLDTEV